MGDNKTTKMRRHLQTTKLIFHVSAQISQIRLDTFEVGIAVEGGTRSTIRTRLPPAAADDPAAWTSACGLLLVVLLLLLLLILGLWLALHVIGH
jgi:hypothetical protein